jgi:hypothetical protein
MHQRINLEPRQQQNPNITVYFNPSRDQQIMSRQFVWSNWTYSCPQPLVNLSSPSSPTRARTCDVEHLQTSPQCVCLPASACNTQWFNIKRNPRIITISITTITYGVQ